MKALSQLWFREDDAPYTVPILVDNSAAITMSKSDQLTRNTCHIESCYWFNRQAVQQGKVAYVKVDGKTQQPADLGTKNIQARDAAPYLNLFEAPYFT